MFLVGLRRHYAVPGIRVVHPQTIQEPITETTRCSLDDTRDEPGDMLEFEVHSKPPRSLDKTVGEDVALTEIVEESAREVVSTTAGSVQATERIRKSGRRQRRKKRAIATEGGQEGQNTSKVQQLCDEIQSQVTDSAASMDKLETPAQPAEPTQAINSILHMLVRVSHPMDTANNTSTNPSSLQTVSAVPPLTITPASPTKPDQFDPDFSSATSDQSTPSTTTSSLFASSSCAESQVSARTQTITHIDTALNPTAPAAAEDKENAPPIPSIETANNEATTRFPPVDLLPPGLPIANIYIHPQPNPISNTLFKPPLPVETIPTLTPSPKSEAEFHAYNQQAGLQYAPDLYFPNAPFAPFAAEHGYMVHPQQFNFMHEPVYIDSFMQQSAPENFHHFAPPEYFAPPLPPPPPPPNPYTMNHQHYTLSLQTPTGGLQFSERSFLAPPESCALSSPQPPPPLSMHYGSAIHRHQEISPNNAYPGKIVTDGFEQMAAGQVLSSPARKSSFGSIGQGRVSNSLDASKHAPMGATQYDVVGWSLF
ncbi:hypothetical protein HDU78_007855 [Chytriomyces hyalinus]|nr:hypothetical protein HDU78_007855 [Chytriomyces hyalinus]